MDAITPAASAHATFSDASLRSGRKASRNFVQHDGGFFGGALLAHSLALGTFAEQAGLSAAGDAVHFRFAGEDGRLAAEVREEMAEGHGFEFVVHLPAARARAELLLEPRAERGVEGLAGLRGRSAFAEFAGEMLREDDAAGLCSSR